MFKIFMLVLILTSYKANADTDFSCILKSNCDEVVVTTIAKSLKWDEILEYFDGFELKSIRLHSQSYPDAYVASFSNGSLSALLFVEKSKGVVRLVSAIEVANHDELKVCNINNDNNDDVCFTAFPKGTNVEPYRAQYVQEGGHFKGVQ